ncbi:uncharacterized protein SPPG_03834 [Spizellomyces punctatus DAOM BR117]|uniref:CDT1 Geminin-binding domain-containing protein n=1 Tax=Spizellomyces punctatus (strain DAOM BR117) TaxID=645134 RepID=A0A0L0HHZ4_SPIPD|nr:uncharacterized protein SPPG_03834 [Spizellomyces punctatus DAOM BR117]KND00717.1 hypothetical protein SPPG_03834 [Spizellomyces punctatus DAOM BR117]|eukprot:XP_016608756.1 hypothetical protein SPPG_03834 [Spizellomyces punctatus DAOM BR117]
MTKGGTTPAATLQSFYPSAKKPNTGGRDKSLKSVDNVIATPTRTIFRKPRLGTNVVDPAGTVETERIPGQTGGKRQRDAAEQRTEMTVFRTPKKTKVDTSVHLQADEISSVDTDPTIGTMDDQAIIRDATSIKGKSAAISMREHSDQICKTDSSQLSSGEIPRTPARKAASRQTPSSLSFVRIDRPRVRSPLPSPTSEKVPEVHDPRESPTTLKFLATPVSSPSGPIILATSSKDIDGSPSSRRGPAYRRYRHLITPGRKLILPSKYELLEKMFHGLEYTIMFMKGRDQPCVYHKIRKAVENMCHRNFELRNLAQIRAVYPEAYRYKAVQTVDRGVKVASVCIDIPDENEEIASQAAPGSAGDSPSIIRGGTLVAPSASAVDSVAMRNKAAGASRSMGERRNEFHKRLLERVHIEHEKFLGTLPYTMNAAKEGELRAWHPQFNLGAVPDITPAEMPELKEETPDFRTVARKRANEASKASHDATSPAQGDIPPENHSPKKSEEGKEHVSMSKDGSAGRQDQASPLPLIPADPLPATSGPPTKPKSRAAALLERIREKERKKMESEMYSKKLTPEEIRKKAMLSRLGDLAQALNFLYVSAGKNVMSLSDVTSHLATSLRSALSEAESREHVGLLADVAPEWCKLSILDIGTFVKIDRGMELAKVKERVQEALAEMTKSET